MTTLRVTLPTGEVVECPVIELQPQFRDAPIRLAVQSWLQDISWYDLLQIYWEAQGLRAAKEERHAARLADQNDFYGKSPEFVKEYFAKKAEACQR